jgi:hypothetical protein
MFVQAGGRTDPEEILDGFSDIFDSFRKTVGIDIRQSLELEVFGR